MKQWSVIIPTRNEEHNIARCLDSLRQLEYPKDRFEVIVVDNGSSDQTFQVAHSYVSTLNLEVISFPKGRVGAVRNAGAWVASGSCLAFLDADCTVGPQWLTHADEALRVHPTDVVGAHYAVPPGASWIARIWHARFHDSDTGDISYLPGGSILMAARTFLLVGGFNPILRSNEDSQFCARARALGIRVLAFPQLAAAHFGADRDLVHFVRRQLWHGGNVVSPQALKGNLKAIGLAAYTLVCCTFVLLGIFFSVPSLFASIAGLLTPALIIALHHGKKHVSPRHIPSLALLLLLYSLVRASVLPLAIIRGARCWNEGK